MDSMDKKDIIKIIGFVTVIVAIYYFIKNAAKRADTSLYSEEGLREIQDDKLFQELENKRVKREEHTAA